MKICPFCPNYMQHVPVPEMEKHGVKVFFCNPCQAECIYFKDDSLASTALYTEINHKIYRWTVASSGTAYLAHIGTPGAPGFSINQNITVIKYFDTKQCCAIPKLTPKTVNNKLKTWLLFL